MKRRKNTEKRALTIVFNITPLAHSMSQFAICYYSFWKPARHTVASLLNKSTLILYYCSVLLLRGEGGWLWQKFQSIYVF